MTVFSFAGLILFITSFLLTFIIFAYSKNTLQRVWGSFNIAVGLWGLGSFFIGGITDKTLALTVWRISEVSVAFIAVLFFHVSYIICNVRAKWLLYFAYFQGVAFSILSLTSPLFFSGTKLVFGSFCYALPGPLFYLFFAIWGFLVGCGHYYLIVTFLHAKGAFRNQIFYLFLGMMTGFSGGITNFLPHFKINFYPFGNFTIPIYSIIATYAILRHRLMDIRIFISRAIAFLVSYTLLLGVPFFFAYRMYPVLQPMMGEFWWFVPVGLLTFFASIAPVAYDQIRRGMEIKLLGDQKRYQKMLLQAASGMAREHNLGRLSKLIAYIVKRIVGIEFAAVFLYDKERNIYSLRAMRDSGMERCVFQFAHDADLIKCLKSKKSPQFYEELSSRVKNELKFSKRVSLIVPSLVDENLLGFVVLGEKNNREPYFEDDVNVFKILTNQAAMAIENCLFFEEFKNVQEKIFTAEKLASIGGMADGVAHQIKNRLNHFSIAAGELKCEINDFIEKHKEFISQNQDLAKTFDYAKQIADSLIMNVKRTDGIIKGILGYARVEEKETFFSYFSLKEIIDVSLELLKIKHELQDFPLEFDLGESDMLYGVKAQMMESIYNILDNGYEAILDRKNKLSSEEKLKFKPLIKLKLTQGDNSSFVEISDNGIGIKDEARQKIFAPFFTTKSSYKSGTGIGMYVVRRIVEENHKGKIHFESAYMQGTKFVVELPKK